MKIEYELQFEDYTEAMLAHQAPVVLWPFAFLLGAVVGVGFLARQQSSNPSAAPILPVLIWVFVGIGVFSTVWTQLRQKKAKPWKRAPQSPSSELWSRRLGRAWIAIVIMGAVSVIFVVFRQQERNPAAIGSPGAANWLDPSSAPWVIIVAVIAAFLLRSGGFGGRHLGRSVLRRNWKSAKHLQQPTAAEFTDAGCVVEQTHFREELKWDFFVGTIETPNLYLLYSNPLSFTIFPKRAFASEAEREAMRQLLRSKVSEPTSAFPVTLK
jgi:hypothetical protein